MSNDAELEAALRASLAERARHTPPTGPLAGRIMAEVEDLPRAGRRRHPRNDRWRTWSLPLVAAGSVAAIVGALVGVSHVRHSAHEAPAVRPSIASTPTPTMPTAPPSTVAPTTASPSPPATTSVAAVPGLTHFHVIDLTFVGDADGWALGTADCLDGSGQPCAAMVRTADGGRTWTSMKQPPANVPLPVCNDPCVQSIRFATPQIGYAFSPSALFMTTDAGRSWQRQPGGADALETLDGNALRVDTALPCSPPGCHYRVQTAQLGSPAWHAVALPGSQPNMSVGVTLSRTGSRAFVEVYGHPAGGAQDARSTLFVSTDDGASWTNRGEPCPRDVGGEVDSTALASAADGSVTLLCTPRGSQGAQYTITSTDGGATFGAPDRRALGAAPVSAFGAASASVLIASSDSTYRSTDGGQTWRRVGSLPGIVTWIGFESATVGRATDGRTVWTTRDAGLDWSAYTFG
ncbi:MAG: hypothetical protein JWO57_3494 [Pseudonocardiales bacterium]|nr:hypothetical protein [Pseudonocardiales bacterium]